MILQKKVELAQGGQFYCYNMIMCYDGIAKKFYENNPNPSILDMI